MLRGRTVRLRLRLRREHGHLLADCISVYPYLLFCIPAVYSGLNDIARM